MNDPFHIKYSQWIQCCIQYNKIINAALMEYIYLILYVTIKS